MKAFVQFYRMSINYDGNHPSKPIEACGSDGVFILDARNSRSTHEQDAIDRLRVLNTKLAKGYVGYSIHKGDLKNNSVITSFTKAA